MGVGIPANLFLLVVTVCHFRLLIYQFKKEKRSDLGQLNKNNLIKAMSKRRKNNLQRSSSILFSLLAVVDILLFLISIIKVWRV